MDDRLEFILYKKVGTTKSTSQWLGLLTHHTIVKCPDCSCSLTRPMSFVSAPNPLVLEINSRNIKMSKALEFVQDGESIVLKVRGLIYHWDFHFTSYIVGTDGFVLYNDGMTTGNIYKKEGDFDEFSNKNYE